MARWVGLLARVRNVLGRMRVEGRAGLVRLGRPACGAGRSRRRIAAQRQDVAHPGGRKMQCPADRLQDLPGRADAPALLQPGVPGDADAGKERHLLAAQSPVTRPANRRQPVIRTQRLVPAGAEEEAEFFSSPWFSHPKILLLWYSYY